MAGIIEPEEPASDTAMVLRSSHSSPRLHLSRVMKSRSHADSR